MCLSVQPWLMQWLPYTNCSSSHNVFYRGVTTWNHAYIPFDRHWMGLALLGNSTPCCTVDKTVPFKHSDVMILFVCTVFKLIYIGLTQCRLSGRVNCFLLTNNNTTRSPTTNSNESRSDTSHSDKIHSDKTRSSKLCIRHVLQIPV